MRLYLNRSFSRGRRSFCKELSTFERITSYSRSRKLLICSSLLSTILSKSASKRLRKLSSTVVGLRSATLMFSQNFEKATPSLVVGSNTILREEELNGGLVEIESSNCDNNSMYLATSSSIWSSTCAEIRKRFSSNVDDTRRWISVSPS